VRYRSSEQRKEAVTEELVDRAAFGMYVLRRHREIPFEELVDGFGTYPLGESGRVHDVAEDSGDDLALAVHGRRRSEQLQHVLRRVRTSVRTRLNGGRAIPIVIHLDPVASRGR
jgi:hypothetical protein